MKKKWRAAVISFGLAVSACFCACSAALAHGTGDQVITEDMLKDLPDENYQVNMEMQREAAEGVYNDWFLEDELQTVSIEIDENNLNYLFQNAMEKPYVMTDSVTIGGETIGYAGLKTKGNYTLEHTYYDFPNSDRFSFTINFGKYIKKKGYGVKQNFYGCSKISFNNFFFDKTMMKEFFSMKLMEEMGVPTPQYGLAKLYINGAYYGIYFMVEAMDSSILEQYLQTEEFHGYLAKPFDCNLLYEKALDKFLTEDGTFDFSAVLKQDKDGEYKASGLLAGQAGLWEMEEDKLSDVAEALPTVLLWERKLSLLSQGRDFDGKELDVNSSEYLGLLETVMDTDEVLRYFAVHSFLVQLDNMFFNDRNFGLSVGTDGRCMLLPWDYDLSFGCFHPGTAEDTANYGIDNMCWFDSVSVGSGSKEQIESVYREHPVFQVIYQNKELMETYHTYLLDCSRIAMLGGTTSFGKTYDPCWFHFYIERFLPKLKEAAEETLAENVQYLNGTAQPASLVQGLPNLSKIIAMRSLGVWVQVRGENAWVSGFGCDLSTLGNGLKNYGCVNEGNLINVDENTGIFLSADYGKAGQNGRYAVPYFSVEKVSAEDAILQEITDAMEEGKKGKLTVYKITSDAKPVTAYTITVPFSAADMEKQPVLYSYFGNALSKMDAVQEGNLYTVQMEGLEYLVVETMETEEQDQKGKELPAGKETKAEHRFFVLFAACAAVILAGAILWHFQRKGGRR